MLGALLASARDEEVDVGSSSCSVGTPPISKPIYLQVQPLVTCLVVYAVSFVIWYATQEMYALHSLCGTLDASCRLYCVKKASSGSLSSQQGR